MHSPYRNTSLPLSHSYLRALSPPAPFYYQWKSSLPKETQGKRVCRREGVQGVRSTLDFLRETQIYIHKITLQGRPAVERRKPRQGVVIGTRRSGTAGRYWKLETRDVKLYQDRAKLVYRFPLHLISPKGGSASHVVLDWGDDLA